MASKKNKNKKKASGAESSEPRREKGGESKPSAKKAAAAGAAGAASEAKPARAKSLDSADAPGERVASVNGNGNGNGSNGNAKGPVREIVVHGHAAEILAELKEPDAKLHMAPDHVHEDPKSFLFKYVFSIDHKIIAIQFMFMALFFLAVSGLLALIVRWQLGFPDQPMPGGGFFPKGTHVSGDGAVLPQFYNQAYTMHASVMIFLVIIPMLVGAFANFLIPLQIGARDMAFPFFNGLSFWVSFLAGGILVSSFFVEGGSAAAGWTSYPPIATLGGLGQQLWFVGVFVVGLSSIMGAVNYITTIINYRAPGMTMMRMPLTVWSLFITSILILFATPVLGSAMIMQFLDGYVGTSFFVPDYANVGGSASDILGRRVGGGHPLTYQHLFWFYSHPAVYIMILPAMGIVSEILSVFARKPIFGYKAMVGAMGLIAFLGYIVWGHHMFVSGMNPYLGSTFMVSTMFIAVPSAIKTFNWLGTLWGGSIRFTTPMLNALAFVSMFVIGGLSGIFMASTPVDIYIHDTYFIVGHIHYVLFGGSMFGIFAGIYHWYPKMFGRQMDETLGKIHFALSFIAFNFTFFPMHILGIGGMMRRIPDPTFYEFLRPLQPINTLITVSALALGAAQLVLVFNFIGSLGAGRGQRFARAAVGALGAAIVAAGLMGSILRFMPGKAGDEQTVKTLELGVEAADAYELYGLQVDSVEKGSPAEAAGLKRGDKIVKVAGAEVFTEDDYYFTLDELEADVESTMTVLRDGAQETTLSFVPRWNEEEEWMEVGVGFPKGVAIADVATDSPAAKAGLQTGDALVSAGGQAIEYAEDFDALVSGTRESLAAKYDTAKKNGEDLAKASTGDPIEFVVERGGEKKTVSVTPSLAVSIRYTENPAAAMTSRVAPDSWRWSFYNTLAKGYWVAVGTVFAAVFIGLLIAAGPTLRIYAIALAIVGAIPMGKIFDVSLDIVSSKANSLTIESVDKDGPAAKAGLKKGDVIVAINGRDVIGERKLREYIGNVGEGSEAEFEIWRDDKMTVVSMAPTPTKDEAKQAEESGIPALGLGAKLSRVSMYHGEHFKAPESFQSQLGEPVFFLFPWLYSWTSVGLTFLAAIFFGWWASKAPLKLDAKAPQNPWNATSLEWVACDSPPWYANFKRLPRVYHGPHEYSVPGLEQDWLPQTVSYNEAAGRGSKPAKKKKKAAASA